MTEQTKTPDEVLAALDKPIRYYEHKLAQCGHSEVARACFRVDMRECIAVRTAVAALIARNAELEADNKALQALVSEWNGEAANLERAGVNAPYYDKGKASGFRQCADNLRTALARTEAGHG